LRVQEKEICKVATWFKTMLGSIIPSRNHHKGDLIVIMSRCTAFGSPIVSSYTQSNNITSELQNLIMTSVRS
jgi:hypothetical protein